MMKDYKLSVIIISRNEENNIAICIESVLKAVENIEDTEIILVDSCSTDRTIEIASKYSINIIQLQPSAKLSPAVGYYIGFKHSHGKLVHFQCGDSVLDEDWFINSIPVLEKDISLGGVAGVISQEPHYTAMAKEYAYTLSRLPVGEVKWFMIDGFYKRKVLVEAGPFNPYLRNNEEGELCYRIIDKGYKLIRLPCHMSHHLGCQEGFISYFKKNLSYAAGYGQVLRYALNNRTIFKWRLYDFKYYLATLFMVILLFFGIAIFFKLGSPIFIYLWIACSLLLLIGSFLEQRTLTRVIKRILYYTVTCMFFLWGFCKPKKDPNIYPDIGHTLATVNAPAKSQRKVS